MEVKDQRTAKDYARVLKDLSDVHFAKAEKITLVQDNLNTHTSASLYEAFEPQEAQRLAKRFEWHYTPKHGSWLNMAELKFPRFRGEPFKCRLIEGDLAPIITKHAYEQSRHASSAGLTVGW